MTKTKDLPSIDKLADNDCLFALTYSGYENKKITIANFKKWLLENVLGVQKDKTEYLDLPSSNFSYNFKNETNNFHLIITLSGTLANGTIVFPLNPTDKQTIAITCSHAITTLALNGNGNTIVSPVTTLSAGGFIRYKYDDLTQKWYRYG